MTGIIEKMSYFRLVFSYNTSLLSDSLECWNEISGSTDISSEIYIRNFQRNCFPQFEIGKEEF